MPWAHHGDTRHYTTLAAAVADSASLRHQFAPSTSQSGRKAGRAETKRMGRRRDITRFFQSEPLLPRSARPSHLNATSARPPAHGGFRGHPRGPVTGEARYARSESRRGAQQSRRELQVHGGGGGGGGRSGALSLRSVLHRVPRRGPALRRRQSIAAARERS